MTVVTTRIIVSPDGTVSTAVPLPAGSHAARVELHDRPLDVDTQSLLQDLRAISLRSAARLRGREMLTDADLYDEDSLPA